jgi:hypothetical protein
MHTFAWDLQTYTRDIHMHGMEQTCCTLSYLLVIQCRCITLGCTEFMHTHTHVIRLTYINTCADGGEGVQVILGNGRAQVWESVWMHLRVTGSCWAWESDEGVYAWGCILLPRDLNLAHGWIRCTKSISSAQKSLWIQAPSTRPVNSMDIYVVYVYLYYV